jgi:hypothetical protein
MTRRLSVLLAVLLFSLAALPQKDTKSRIEAATGGDKAKFALEYTEQSVKTADKAFKDGKDEEGSAALKEVKEYAKVASDAAIQSGKHDKDVEINLRKVVNHLVEVKNARPYDQQDEVQQAIDAVDSARNNLLESMFKKKH